MSSFWNSKNVKIHLSYMAIIAAVIAYSIYARHPDAAVVAFTEETLSASKVFLENDIANMVFDIHKKARDYPSSQSTQYQMFADSLIEFHKKLLEDSITFTNNAYIAVKVILRARHSFLYLADKDDHVTRAINSLLPADFPFSSLQSNMPPGAVKLLTEIRLLLAVKAVLQYHASKISGTDIRCFEKKPEMSSQNWAPRAGENFQGEVFMQIFQSTFDENQKIRVDGALLDIKDGVGVFNKRYTSPGLKKILVEIENKNSLTGQTEVYKKEFSVRVLE